MIAGEHVAHGIAPAGLADEAHRRAAAGESSVRVLVLAEVGVGRGDPDVARQVDFVSEVPGVAMRHDDERLRSGAAASCRADRSSSAAPTVRCPAAIAGLRRVDVDAARELLAMPEQHDARAATGRARIDRTPRASRARVGGSSRFWMNGRLRPMSTMSPRRSTVIVAEALSGTSASVVTAGAAAV